MKHWSFFLKTNLIVLAITNCASVLNFLCQIYLARNLDADGLGIYAATSSIAVVFFSFFGVVPMVVAKACIQFGEVSERKKRALTSLFLLFGGVALVCVAVLLVVAPWIALSLKIPSSLPIRIFSIQLGLIVPVAFLSGVFAGEQRFALFAIKDLSLAIARLAAFFLFVGILAKSYIGALSADVVATLLTFLILIFMGRSKTEFSWCVLGQKGRWQDLPSLLLYAVPVALTQWLIGVVSQADILIVKAHLIGTEAGIYAAMSGLSKIPFFVGGALMAVLLPRVMSEAHQKTSSLGSAVVAISLTFVCSAAVSSLIVFFSGSIVRTVLGERYIAGAPILSLGAISMSILAMVGVLFNFFLGKGIYGFLLPSVCALGVGIGLVMICFNTSAIAVAQGWLGLVSILLAVNLMYLFIRFRKEFRALAKNYI